MGEADEVFTRVIIDRDRYLQIAAERLLNQLPYSMSDITPKKIPNQAGIYILNHKEDERPFHIGEARNLRQRIYTNQLQGTIQQSALKKKLHKSLGLEEDAFLLN